MRIQQEWQFLVKGIIIIAAVAAGAMSEILRHRNVLRRKKNEQIQASTKA
jgi:ribose/xylose/arabinose/galactoside ABC-type transport system permease subunit